MDENDVVAVAAAIREDLVLWLPDDVDDEYVDQAARVTAINAVCKMDELQPPKKPLAWMHNSVELGQLISAGVLLLTTVVLVLMLINSTYTRGRTDGIEWMANLRDRTENVYDE